MPIAEACRQSKGYIFVLPFQAKLVSYSGTDSDILPGGTCLGGIRPLARRRAWRLAAIKTVSVPLENSRIGLDRGRAGSRTVAALCRRSASERHPVYPAGRGCDEHIHA